MSAHFKVHIKLSLDTNGFDRVRYLVSPTQYHFLLDNTMFQTSTRPRTLNLAVSTVCHMKALMTQGQSEA